jgi:hypothetical protein
MVHTFYLEEYTERKEKMQVYLIEIDVQEPEYLDHFFLDSSEYTAYPNEGEVVVSEYNVYKCLDNNYDFDTSSGSASTVMPTGTDVEPFITSDGYKWKFMMNLPLALRNKFLMSSYMPITTALRSNFFNNGGLDTIIIENPGSGYNTYESTVITVNTSTGSDAVLIPVIKDGVIVSVSI